MLVVHAVVEGRYCAARVHLLWQIHTLWSMETCRFTFDNNSVKQ